MDEMESGVDGVWMVVLVTSGYGRIKLISRVWIRDGAGQRRRKKKSVRVRTRASKTG
jgi:hypothetical protein